MSGDPRDQNWTSDEYGDTWLIGGDGQYVRDADGSRIPGPAAKNPDDGSGFSTYDSSRGHCSLCGRLTCRGECFK